MVTMKLPPPPPTILPASKSCRAWLGLQLLVCVGGTSFESNQVIVKRSFDEDERAERLPRWGQSCLLLPPPRASLSAKQLCSEKSDH